jgi:hypothetical protein
MNIYEYNSSTINHYSIEDFQNFSSFVEMDDYGNLTDKINDREDFYQIDCNSTLVPFGSINLKGTKTKYNTRLSEFERVINLNEKSIILHGIIIRWIGYSILFQLSGDLCRNVIPDVSGGGKS